MLIPMSLLVAFLALQLTRKRAREEAFESAAVDAKSEAAQTPAEISPVVPLDPISLELGYGLIPLVDKDQSSELLDRITRIRREAALELGWLSPVYVLLIICGLNLPNTV